MSHYFLREKSDFVVGHYTFILYVPLSVMGHDPESSCVPLLWQFSQYPAEAFCELFCVFDSFRNIRQRLILHDIQGCTFHACIFAEDSFHSENCPVSFCIIEFSQVKRHDQSYIFPFFSTLKHLLFYRRPAIRRPLFVALKLIQ